MFCLRIQVPGEYSCTWISGSRFKLQSLDP